MDKINNSYIRGFGDGEGYVCQNRFLLVLTNTNKELLEDISKYLNKIGISHNFKEFKSKNVKHKICYRIMICKKISLLRYLQKIGFNDLRKQERLVTMLEGSRCVDWELKKRSISRLRRKGLSIRKIANLLDIHFMTVFRYLH